MEVFKERPVLFRNAPVRKLVCGVGINDADYALSYNGEDGKRLRCPYYARWSKMINRCYSESCLKTRPRYKGCTVSEEWLRFSNFRKWMEKQDWEGKQLDKDIKIYGNKVYSKDSCMFVSLRLNTLFVRQSTTEGSLPQGVSWHKGAKKYRADIKGKLLGLYDDECSAETAYCKEKFKQVISVAYEDLEVFSDTELQDYVIKEAIRFSDRIENIEELLYGNV